MGLLGGAIAWLTGETQRQQQAEIEAQRAREMQAQQERAAREALEREQQREAAIRQLEQSRQAWEQQREQEAERKQTFSPTERLFEKLQAHKPEAKQPETVREVEATEMQYQPTGLQRAPTLAGPGMGVTAVSRTTQRQRAREQQNEPVNNEITPTPEPTRQAEPEDLLEVVKRHIADREAKEAERLAAMTPAERELEQQAKQREAARERGRGRSFYPDYSRGRTMEMEYRPGGDQSRH